MELHTWQSEHIPHYILQVKILTGSNQTYILFGACMESAKHEILTKSLQWKPRYNETALCSPSKTPFIIDQLVRDLFLINSSSWIVRGLKFHENLSNRNWYTNEKFLRCPSKVVFIIDLSQPNLQWSQKMRGTLDIWSFRKIPAMGKRYRGEGIMFSK